jgi:hypothetical protein
VYYSCAIHLWLWPGLLQHGPVPPGSTEEIISSLSGGLCAIQGPPGEYAGQSFICLVVASSVIPSSTSVDLSRNRTTKEVIDALSSGLCAIQGPLGEYAGHRNSGKGRVSLSGQKYSLPFSIKF